MNLYVARFLPVHPKNSEWNALVAYGIQIRSLSYNKLILKMVKLDFISVSFSLNRYERKINCIYKLKLNYEM